MTIDLAQLAQAIEASDATDLAALLTAKESAKKAMLDEASAANVQAFERARRALESFVRPEESEPQRVFRNRIEALAWLQAQGYAIRKSKLYDDVDRGHLKLQADKSVLQRDLERYVKRVGLEKPAEAAPGDPDGRFARKLELAIALLEEDLKEKTFKNEVLQGKYIPREQVQMEIAGHAAVFDAGLTHGVETRAAALEESLQVIAEKHERIAYIRRWFREILGEQLNEFANLRSYQVLLLDHAGELEDANL